MQQPFRHSLVLSARLAWPTSVHFLNHPISRYSWGRGGGRKGGSLTIFIIPFDIRAAPLLVPEGVLGRISEARGCTCSHNDSPRSGTHITNMAPVVSLVRFRSFSFFFFGAPPVLF
ncbi:hypothetical protein, unlikely [Trypanosoma brucei gambiense DAL972]|uniref:Uncharacterized protein n=1 Tax=Trypanosoma brucei gambiense (strain MHOM/CI/86/DAL972) TaxID=679716 RepID=C9ZNH7_TRYB9|nr:hypothetical protein, unlikely [Trypanosoma brucei gambiense DAL972]CBH10955.1 hypothetical protein, unlikely [Trypanosoma brucei gambiense DAL972]|eukprot:XP_011773242.1 hypothetical protein, unlikely [Trypanosoma brucei gambiense DAL972]